MKDYRVRFLVTFFLSLTFVILLVTLLTSVFMRAQAERERKFQDTCQTQEGRYLIIDKRPYCIIDGVKIGMYDD